jgi:hypothetical protein
MYLNEPFAKVYDHPQEPKLVVLAWGKVQVGLAQGQAAVEAVLGAVQTHQKTGLLALIDAEGYDPAFLDWLVEHWYGPAHQSGLARIAHQMGTSVMAIMSAEIVAWEDKSGILFKNFYVDSPERPEDWLLG